MFNFSREQGFLAARFSGAEIQVEDFNTTVKQIQCSQSNCLVSISRKFLNFKVSACDLFHDCNICLKVFNFPAKRLRKKYRRLKYACADFFKKKFFVLVTYFNVCCFVNTTNKSYSSTHSGLSYFSLLSLFLTQ